MIPRLVSLISEFFQLGVIFVSHIMRFNLAFTAQYQPMINHPPLSGLDQMVTEDSSLP